jgi:hypothetical protein
MELQLEDFALAPLIDGVVKTIPRPSNRDAVCCTRSQPLLAQTRRADVL